MPTQQRHNRTPLPGNFDIDGFAEIVAQKIWGKIAKMTNIPDEWLTLKASRCCGQRRRVRFPTVSEGNADTLPNRCEKLT